MLPILSKIYMNRYTFGRGSCMYVSSRMCSVSNKEIHLAGKSWFSWNFHRCSVFLSTKCNGEDRMISSTMSKIFFRKYSACIINQAIARVSQDVNFHRRPQPNFPSRLPVKSVPLTHVESFHGHNPLQARFECSIKVNLRYRGESDSIKIKIR